MTAKVQPKKQKTKHMELSWRLTIYYTSELVYIFIINLVNVKSITQDLVIVKDLSVTK